MAKILVVDDEQNIRAVLKGLLAKNGFTDVLAAENGKQALELVQDNAIDLIISDISMPVMDGLKLFEEVRGSGVIFIVITAIGTVEMAVDLMKKGVYDFISKPFDETELINTVKKALIDAGKSLVSLRAASGMDEVFFDSANGGITAIKENIIRVARTRAGVLITGETGTGKGLVASYIHKCGNDNSAPFIHVNCAAIPSGLMEAELLGYKKGAFTGAVCDKPGKFELADKGTIFLDEVGELHPELQAKLLTVLQEKQCVRLGDVKPVKFDCRVIAATNIDIKKAVRDKKFREDLYFRLNVVEFDLPPLRARAQDIPAFVEFFNNKYTREYDVEKKVFEKDALDYMKNCRFSGNIRELENVIQKVLVMEREKRVNAKALENFLKKEEEIYTSDNPGLAVRVKDEKVKIEEELIRKALRDTGGNRTDAARQLGISRRTLLYRLKEYGIE